MSVITVTPNVALDQTVTLDKLTPGQVHRAKSVFQNAGGKGVNVSSCLADWGVPSVATGFVGRDNAEPFEALCGLKGIEDAFLRVDGASRVNIKLVDAKDTTDVNLPGPTVTDGDLRALEARLDSLARTASLAVLAGSLPLGCPHVLYRGLVGRLREAGVRTILDSSEQPLRLALEGELLPYCLKPNRLELSQAVGRDLPDLEDVLREARGLIARGVGLLAVSLGEEGALFVSARHALLARGRVRELVSTVGAGDALVAGLAAALDEACRAGREEADPERLARLAVAFSTAKLGLPGPNLPGRDVVESHCAEVELRSLDA